jgi:predicted nucleic acid-binding protein
VITVSNTAAITTLLKVGRVDLLTNPFGEVWIPSAVEQELLAYHARFVGPGQGPAAPIGKVLSREFPTRAIWN